MNHRKTAAAVLALLFLATFSALAQVDDATRQMSHDILKELIEINTTDFGG